MCIKRNNILENNPLSRRSFITLIPLAILALLPDQCGGPTTSAAGGEGSQSDDVWKCVTVQRGDTLLGLAGGLNVKVEIDYESDGNPDVQGKVGDILGKATLYAPDSNGNGLQSTVCIQQ